MMEVRINWINVIVVIISQSISNYHIIWPCVLQSPTHLFSPSHADRNSCEERRRQEVDQEQVIGRERREGRDREKETWAQRGDMDNDLEKKNKTSEDDVGHQKESLNYRKKWKKILPNWVPF